MALSSRNGALYATVKPKDYSTKGPDSIVRVPLAEPRLK